MGSRYLVGNGRGRPSTKSELHIFPGGSLTSTSKIRKTYSRAIRADIVPQTQGEYYTTLRVMQNKQWLHFRLTPEQERDLLSQLLGADSK